MKRKSNILSGKTLIFDENSLTKKEIEKISLIDYPYGRVTPRLRKAVKWLNDNKENISCKQQDYFDYPDYWGMPKRIANRLYGDEVDFLQAETNGWYQSIPELTKETEKYLEDCIKKNKKLYEKIRGQTLYGKFDFEIHENGFYCRFETSENQ